jgi:hypothetical protein
MLGVTLLRIRGDAAKDIELRHAFGTLGGVPRPIPVEA